MPSHAYFFATDAQPDWGAEELPPETPAAAAQRQRIADAILAGLPGVQETQWGEGQEWIELWCPAFEIVIHTGFVHLRLRWRSAEEMRERGLPGVLHHLARILLEVAGYDFFEHGCQGIGSRGDIDRVIDAISGTSSRIDAVMLPAGGIKNGIVPVAAARA